MVINQKTLFLSLVLLGFASIGHSAINQNSIVQVLTSRFEAAKELSEEEYKNLASQNRTCSQYCLFRDGFVEIPGQKLWALARVGGKGYLRKTEEGDLIGEWTVPRTGENVAPGLLRSIRHKALEVYGRAPSRQRRLAKVPSVSNKEGIVGFYLYCPK